MNSDFLYSQSLLVILGMSLLVGWAVALAGVLLIDRAFPLKARLAEADLLGHAAGIIGVMNAVLLAFIVFAAWTDYDRARDLVSQEASLVLDIWRDFDVPLASGRPQEGRGMHDRGVEGLEEYLVAVIGTEWKATATGERPVKAGDESPFRDGWKSLASSYSQLLNTEAQKSLRPALAEELIKRFNSLFDARRERIAVSRHGGLTRTVWAVVLVGGLLSLASCWLLGFESRKLHVTSTMLVATTFGLIIFLIIALEWPFRGEKQIRNDPYCEALNTIYQGERHGWHRPHERTTNTQLSVQQVATPCLPTECQDPD